jgi:hypothetical protein
MTKNNKQGDKEDNNNPEDNRIAVESNQGNNEQRKSYEYGSGPERWILYLGIAITVMGVVLLTLRSVIFSLVLIIAGVSVFTYWLYSNARLSGGGGKPSIITGADKHDEECICAICGHRASGMCIQNRCPCCILMKDDKIIGHSNNPLQ